MKPKHTMVILLAVAVSLPAIPSMAFAADMLPETLDAKEQLSFDPLVYVTVLLAAVLLCSVIVSIVFVKKYQRQKALLCHNYTCHNNPKARDENDGVFDYRKMETPSELTRMNPGADSAIEEVISSIAATLVPGFSAAPVQNNRTQGALNTASQVRPGVLTSAEPSITIPVLPGISEPAKPSSAASSDLNITAPLAVPHISSQEQNLPSLNADPIARPVRIGKHQRLTNAELQAEQQWQQNEHDRLLQEQQRLQGEVRKLLGEHQRLLSKLPEVKPRIALVTENQIKPARRFDVPEELEYLVRKIS